MELEMTDDDIKYTIQVVIISIVLTSTVWGIVLYILAKGN